MKNIWNKKFPTLIGILIITFATFITTYLVGGETIFKIKAGPGQDPKNVKASNISDSSFTISYITDDKVIGTVNYGLDPNNLDSVALDDRDQLSQKINSYNYHSISLKNLNENTVYYYSITSGDKKYLNKEKYKTKTGSLINKDPSMQIPISGKALLPDGSTPNEGLVYVKINDSQETVSLIKEDGTYFITLNTLRTSDNNNYYKISQNSKIKIEIFASRLYSSLLITPNEISPVPLITLSNNYDFQEEVTPTQSKKVSNPGFPIFGKVPVKSNKINKTPIN